MIPTAWLCTALHVHIHTCGPALLGCRACRRKWSSLAQTCLVLARSLELRLWDHDHPLRQFEGHVRPGPCITGRRPVAPRWFIWTNALWGRLRRCHAEGQRVRSVLAGSGA